MLSAVKKVISPKYKNLIFKFAIRILWFFKFDTIIAWLVAYVLVSHNNSKLFSVEHNAILALDRSIFNEDREALDKYREKHNLPYQFILYPSFIRAILSDAIWPYAFREQVAFYAKRNEHHRFLRRITRIYEKILYFFERNTKIKIKFVLTALMDYAQDYPWIKAIRNYGGQFIVLNKESIIYSDYFKDDLRTIYKKSNFNFEGDAALFYCVYGRDAYIAADSVRPDQSYVTGCPRVDELIVSVSAPKKYEEPFILVAAFMDPLYGVPRLWNDVLDVIHSDTWVRSRVIVKCRDTREIPLIHEKFPHINAVTGSLGKYLKKSPAAFVGFNSTTCLDAFIAEVPVVVPWWADAEQMVDKSLLGPHTKDFHNLAFNRGSFVKILRDYLEGCEKEKQNVTSWRNNPKLKEFIEYKYTPLDGKNCERFFEFLKGFNISK